LEDRLPDDQLRAMLKNQLEYYFSRYLCSWQLIPSRAMLQFKLNIHVNCKIHCSECEFNCIIILINIFLMLFIKFNVSDKFKQTLINIINSLMYVVDSVDF